MIMEERCNKISRKLKPGMDVGLNDEYTATALDECYMKTAVIFSYTETAAI